MVLLFYPSPVSPKGEKLMPPETKVALLWTITTVITQQAPFPFGKGGGIGPFPSSSPPLSLALRVIFYI
jgi:hypothetical protein